MAAEKTSWAVGDWTCVPKASDNPFLYTMAAYHTCPAAPAVPQTLTMTVPASRRKPDGPATVHFKYFSSGNTPIERTPHVSRVVISQHGATRVAASYLCAMQGAAAAAGKEDGTAIIAPFFSDTTDPGHEADAEGRPLLHWDGVDKNGVWRAGGPDVTDSVSSFDVMDAIIAALPCETTARAPLVIIGHSSGGQFVQRYALVGEQRRDRSCLRGDDEAPAGVTNVVVNPSSYVWLDATRPSHAGDDALDGGGPAATEWSVPDTSAEAACPAFDKWGFGLKGAFPKYRGSCVEVGADGHVNLTACVTRYATRDMVYLLGGNETCTVETAKSGPRHGMCPDHGLETTCGDLFEGPSRLRRGRNFFAYQRAFFQARGVAPLSRYREAPFVGHDHTGMFQSPEGLKAVFGRDG